MDEDAFCIRVLFGPFIGVHKIEAPADVLTRSINVSILQIKVSLNAKLSDGLSTTVSVFVTVSIHPTLFATISLICVVSAEGYFQAVSFACAVSAKVVASPKSHKRLLIVPYFVTEVSLNR